MNMPAYPCRYSVTLAGESPIGHLDIEADDAAVQDGALLLFRRGHVIWVMRQGGWSVCCATQFEKAKEVSPS